MVRPVDLESYDNARALFSTCRSEAKGKPLPGRWRMFREDDDYVIAMERWGSYDPLPVCTISPDNVVTFDISEKDLVQYSNSICMVLWKILPIGIIRKRSGVYSIGPVAEGATRWYGYPCSKRSCEYFRGLQIRLGAVEILNPKPNFTDQVLPDVKKAWLRDLKRFKKGLKVRAKVGALNGVIEDIEQSSANWKTTGKNFWQFQESRAQVDAPEAVELVLECMREDEYPPELLTSLAFWGYCNHGPYARREFDQQHMLQFIDRMFTNHSLMYRKAYGVFGEID